MRFLVVAAALLLASCDHISQRVWNCSNAPLSVIKVLSTGERVADKIPPRSYIASMEGGTQIVALEAPVAGRQQVIWRQDQARSVTNATADNACGAQTQGLIGQQF